MMGGQENFIKMKAKPIPRFGAISNIIYNKLILITFLLFKIQIHPIYKYNIHENTYRNI